MCIRDSNSPGNAWVTVNGGSGSYTVQVSGAGNASGTVSSNSFPINNLAAGTYNVEIIDNNTGCSDWQTLTIGNNGGALNFVLEPNAASCNGPGNAWVTVN